MQGNQQFQSNVHRRAGLSKHAERRSQQRGIPQSALPLILAYGEKEFDGRGGIRYLMTGASMRDLQKVVGHTSKVDALAGVYAVVSTVDQTIITIGHRHS